MTHKLCIHMYCGAEHRPCGPAMAPPGARLLRILHISSQSEDETQAEPCRRYQGELMITLLSFVLQLRAIASSILVGWN